MADKDPMASGEVTASAEVAVGQQGDGGHPKPGDEGYVHPDGTPQSQRQLEDNRRAAADRAAAGSTVHGAPLATPGPDPEGATHLAVQRAEEYSGTSPEDARKGQTEYVRDSLAEGAEAAEKRRADADASNETTRAGRKAATGDTVRPGEAARTPAAATQRTTVADRPVDKR